MKSNALAAVIEELTEAFSEQLLKVLRGMPIGEIAGDASAPAVSRAPRTRGRVVVERMEEDAPDAPDRESPVGSTAMRDLQQEILQALAEAPNGLRQEELRAALKVEKPRLVRELKVLLENNILTKSGNLRGTRYALPPAMASNEDAPTVGTPRRRRARSA